MFGNLTALALGIVIFAIMIGIGVVVITKFANAVATCGTGFAFNDSLRLCQNATNFSDTTAAVNTGYTTTNAFNTELGTTSGLGSWTAAIVALAVGLLFIGALMGRRKY